MKVRLFAALVVAVCADVCLTGCESGDTEQSVCRGLPPNTPCAVDRRCDAAGSCSLSCSRKSPCWENVADIENDVCVETPSPDGTRCANTFSDITCFDPETGVVDCPQPAEDAVCVGGLCVSDPCPVEGELLNELLGTCFVEECVEGHAALVLKPTGAECVYRPGGSTEWAAGHCAADGVCGPM